MREIEPLSFKSVAVAELVIHTETTLYSAPQMAKPAVPIEAPTRREVPELPNPFPPREVPMEPAPIPVAPAPTPREPVPVG